MENWRNFVSQTEQSLLNEGRKDRRRKFAEDKGLDEEKQELDEDIEIVDEKKKRKKNPCWKGYRKVKGKADYEKGSCKKISEELDEDIELYEEDDLAEAGGKCTKATKKASSDAKGKKYTRCVKNPDGKGYKRIHWGQKGVKATGKSGNTGRKKSFRKRHGCSTAKPGTPKAEACKDW